ncbi:MAG: beta-lactamase family protein [Deltaproteobacteria bacterium]|nr:beta-lactamase family protein [Deltaproteobacteria bacterium]
MTRAGAGESTRFREAADLLDEGVREEAYAAAVLRIARGDEVLFERSAGYARAASLFDVASLTKPLTAALFFVLSQEGHLSPDGVAAEVLPFTSPDRRVREIRFSHLLSHTSGLPAWRPLYEQVAAAETAEGRPLSGTAEGHDRILAEVLSLPLSHDPGTGWEYSDLGYMLLGRAIEVAGFRSLDRLLASMVTGPLGMRETRYLPLSAISECETGQLIPTGWSEVRQREKAGEVDDENAAAMGGVSGHAGLFSTAGDLFLFAREIVRARKGEGRVLSRPSAAMMTTKVAQPPGCPRTMGFDTPTPPDSQAGERAPADAVGHLGYTGCSMWNDPGREISVILLTNRVVFGSGNRKLSALRPRIHDAVWKEIAG